MFVSSYGISVGDSLCGFSSGMSVSVGNGAMVGDWSPDQVESSTVFVGDSLPPDQDEPSGLLSGEGVDGSAEATVKT